jgi:hypothetical protein
LPDDASGFAFFTFAEPDRPWGPVMFWRLRADGQVRGDDEWARIGVLVPR